MKAAGTIMASNQDACKLEAAGEMGYRIRSLTPRECWRLMGFKDKDYDAAEKVSSNAALYAQAGNAIVVDVLEEIFRQMIEPKEQGGQMSIFDFIKE